MSTVLATARIDYQLKTEADSILMKMGLTSSEFIRICYAQLRNKHAIPFKISVDQDEPNEKLIQAMTDAENQKNLVSFDNVDDFMEWLDK